MIRHSNWSLNVSTCDNLILKDRKQKFSSKCKKKKMQQISYIVSFSINPNVFVYVASLDPFVIEKNVRCVDFIDKLNCHMREKKK